VLTEEFAVRDLVVAQVGEDLLLLRIHAGESRRRDDRLIEAGLELLERVGVVQDADLAREVERRAVSVVADRIIVVVARAEHRRQQHGGPTDTEHSQKIPARLHVPELIGALDHNRVLFLGHISPPPHAGSNRSQRQTDPMARRDTDPCRCRTKSGRRRPSPTNHNRSMPLEPARDRSRRARAASAGEHFR
jgi:hypothetical protein